MTQIENLHMRYLSYYYNDFDSVALNLRHPHSIVSLAVHKVHIINMHKCSKLKNFYSSHNHYNMHSFDGLAYMKRVVSQNDSYNGFNTLIE